MPHAQMVQLVEHRVDRGVFVIGPAVGRRDEGLTNSRTFAILHRGTRYNDRAERGLPTSVPVATIPRGAAIGLVPAGLLQPAARQRELC